MIPVKAIVTDLLRQRIEWPSAWELGADEFAFRASNEIHKRVAVNTEQAEHIAVCIWKSLRDARDRTAVEA